MTSLLGQCVGVVKNTISSNPNDSNCNWKSGDENYALAAPGNSKVKFITKKRDSLDRRNKF
jgi:hypothetical protein